MIQVSTEDIQYAERLLFGRTGLFDTDRIQFIKHFGTLDLHAAPGSGKTTALLAKLAILEKSMPFVQNEGVLVISHTNTAVDEIKEKLEKHCPQLFTYPNFVGTIQGFVDQFLTEPYYSIVLRRKIFRIDNEAYEEALFKHLQKPINSDQETFRKIRHIKNANPDLLKNYRLRTGNRGEPIVCGSMQGEVLNPKKPRSRTDYSADDKRRINNYLLELKRIIIKEGILCYDDAYYLANKYLYKFPKIIQLLRERFSYVFVDEMQDMDMHQVEVLEKIFYQEHAPEFTFQRIGDKNQSIYSGRFPSEDVWNTAGRTSMTLPGSRRFHQRIAEFVKPFAMAPIDMAGNKEIKECQPILLIYNDTTVENVIPFFPKLIKNEALINKVDLDHTITLKAIAWRKSADQGKTSIQTYFPNFDKDGSVKKVDFQNLISYLSQNFQPEKGLAEIRKTILNALLKLFRIEGIKVADKVYITKNQFIRYVEHSAYYPEFQQKLYLWSAGVYRNQAEQVHKDINRTIRKVLSEFFNHTTISNQGKSFVEDTEVETAKQEEKKEHLNRYACPETGLQVDVASVHSVKGETHFATMYMESSYEGSYESKRMIDQLLGNKFDNPRVYHKQTARMMYVGLSRPVQFLVFACHEDNVKEHLEHLKKRWKINTQLINQ